MKKNISPDLIRMCRRVRNRGEKKQISARKCMRLLQRWFFGICDDCMRMINDIFHHIFISNHLLRILRIIFPLCAVHAWATRTEIVIENIHEQQPYQPDLSIFSWFSLTFSLNLFLSSFINISCDISVFMCCNSFAVLISSSMISRCGNVDVVYVRVRQSTSLPQFFFIMWSNIIQISSLSKDFLLTYFF